MTRTVAFVSTPFASHFKSARQSSTRAVPSFRTSGVFCRTSLFTGSCLPLPRVKRAAVQRIGDVRMVVDPWSVSPEAVDQIAAQLFASSLFPYLGFLYFMGRTATGCPQLANFGFRFLLVFVFATIPAGIYAKQAYGDILANIDLLHGSAESLLTLTNLFIVLGFRQALSTTRSSSASSPATTQLLLNGGVVLLGIAAAAYSFLGAAPHAEPYNALSFPTWAVHTSSLFEWLAAMGLVWQYADFARNPRWKGLVWAMLPLHTSGICACTYHLFYNASALNSLVALQAGLTAFGNACMGVATWRIWKYANDNDSSQTNAAGIDTDGEETKQIEVSKVIDPGSQYFTLLLAITLGSSALVKYGSLNLDFLFNPSLPVALGIILVPSALNAVKWVVRSKTGKESFGGML